jgi:AcrR family transcriptional regulator
MSDGKNSFDVGRPPAELDRQVVDSLIEATVRLLREKPRAEITVREIAHAAGANKAMIGYYFQSKDGLFFVLIEHLSNRLMSALKQVEKELETADLRAINPTRLLITAVINTFTENAPGLKLVITEIQLNSNLKMAYMERFASHGTQVFRRIIRSLIERGVYRADLDPNYTTFALETLLAQHVLNESVMQAIFNLTPGVETTQKWTDYLVEMFDHGLRPAS